MDMFILMIASTILLLIILLVLILFIPSKKSYPRDINVRADLKKIKRQISPEEEFQIEDDE